MFDTLPEGLPRLISIGRLDINSEGLLLLTNDGALKRAPGAARHRLAAPLPGAGPRHRRPSRRWTRWRRASPSTASRYGPIEARLDSRAGRATCG